MCLKQDRQCPDKNERNEGLMKKNRVSIFWKYVRILLNIIIPIVGTVLICTVGMAVVRFFLPFLIGWLIAMIAGPLVRFLDTKVKILRSFSSFAIIVVVLGGIVAALCWMVSWLGRQVVDLIQNMPALESTMREQAALLQDKLAGLVALLPEEISVSVDNTGSKIIDYLAGYIGDFSQPVISAAGGFVSAIPNAFVYLIVTILSAYFFLADKENISKTVSEVMPASLKEKANLMKGRAASLVGGYFFAQLKIMCMIYIILVIGFLIMGVDYSGLIALLVALLDFLPVFGTGTVLIPWAIIELIMGDYLHGIGMLVLYGVTLLSRQLLQPKLVGDAMGLNPLTTLVFMYLGFRFSGIAGMILAVPIGMMVIELYHIGIFDSFLKNCALLIRGINDFRRGDVSENEQDEK